MGVLMTMLLVIFTSCIGISLVKTRDEKLYADAAEAECGRKPGGRDDQDCLTVLAGFLLLLPGFFTDFIGLLLLLPPYKSI